jgi:hypothetical protein
MHGAGTSCYRENGCWAGLARCGAGCLGGGELGRHWSFGSSGFGLFFFPFPFMFFISIFLIQTRNISYAILNTFLA